MTGDEQRHRTDNRHTRLRWRCRRGTRELDLLLSGFMEGGYFSLEDQQLSVFERLLDYPDDELLDLLMGRKVAGDRGLADVIARIQGAVASNA
ncbi:MAG: succinate dehydrogenase assembly factor 2 [Gammaproteobacteria bacterium]|nr:succinate dehydrogenase assembly factor 2 [Gammaproteobacteria bacterium]